MIDAQREFSLHARLIIPVESPPLFDGYVTIRGDSIVDVSDQPKSATIYEIGDAAILPGLVNAHTHLEFSDFRTPLGQVGMPLPDWIGKVVAHRRHFVAELDDPIGYKSEVISRGLGECLQTATVAVGEIATQSWNSRTYESSEANVTIFQELIGLSPTRTESILNLATSHVELAAATPMTMAFGLSPHAPYTVHPNLVQSICEMSRAAGLPVAMHLAESPEEIRLLSDGNGPFVELLESLGAWDANAIPKGSRPIDYLRQLVASPQSLVIHGNYLSEDEIEYVARHNDRMKVVYCPRTHLFFDHAPYPLRKMLDCGIEVALGTDSRASSPDLSVWSEILAVKTLHPTASPKEILKMGTISSAKALGVQDRFGSISPGKSAQLAKVDLNAWDRDSPYESLLDGQPPQLISYEDLRELSR